MSECEEKDVEEETVDLNEYNCFTYSEDEHTSYWSIYARTPGAFEMEQILGCPSIGIAKQVVVALYHQYTNKAKS